MSADEQPRHCFSANRPGWVDEVQEGDVLLAGRNFGVGSGRPIGEVFVRLGIKAVVAESFNGLGLRNCVNVGLPSLPCPGILDAFEEGDVAEVDAVSGVVRNLTSGASVTGKPLPLPIQEIVKAGGVEQMLRAAGHLAPAGSKT
jgi:3-isopropylmalate/(R)-2-methylmalate dehydratase small subunit